MSQWELDSEDNIFIYYKIMYMHVCHKYNYYNCTLVLFDYNKNVTHVTSACHRGIMYVIIIITVGVAKRLVLMSGLCYPD